MPTASAARRPPIQVLRIITRLNIGGPAIHAILLTQGLDDDAFQSTLVTGTTASHEGDFTAMAQARGVRPIVVPELGREISIADDIAALARMVRLIRSRRPDVVHTHMAKAGTVGRLAARLCRVPLVVHTYHGHVFHGYFGPRKTRMVVAIERALAAMTDRLVVVGDSQRDEIAGYGVAPRAKLVPIRLGLELQPFLRADRHRGELRRELGIPDAAPVVGIVARLVPIKAHEHFFRAARRVLDRYPETRLVVVGDGERRRELEEMVDGMGLRPSTHFLGWRRDLPRVYADMDVVALTSLNEGSPVVLIEALAAARPVVGTAVGGVPEVVLDGLTGLTVPPAQPALVADAVIRLLDDRTLRDRLASAGRAHVYPRYDSARLVHDMRRLYSHELAARGRVVSDDRPLPESAPVEA